MAQSKQDMGSGNVRSLMLQLMIGTSLPTLPKL